MVQRKHKRPGFSPNSGSGNVEWFSVNTSDAAFPEIDQANVEWFSVNTSGAAFRQIDQANVEWFSVNTSGLVVTIKYRNKYYSEIKTEMQVIKKVKIGCSVLTKAANAKEKGIK